MKRYFVIFFLLSQWAASFVGASFAELKKADELVTQRKFAAAEAAYNKLAESGGPAAVPALFNLGTTLLENGRNVAAANAFGRALNDKSAKKLGPSRLFDLYNNHGHASRRVAEALDAAGEDISTDWWKKAGDSFASAHKLRPKDNLLAWETARCLVRGGASEMKRARPFLTIAVREMASDVHVLAATIVSMQDRGVSQAYALAAKTFDDSMHKYSETLDLLQLAASQRGNPVSGCAVYVAALGGTCPGIHPSLDVSNLLPVPSTVLKDSLLEVANIVRTKSPLAAAVLWDAWLIHAHAATHHQVPFRAAIYELGRILRVEVHPPSPAVAIAEAQLTALGQWPVASQHTPRLATRLIQPTNSTVVTMTPTKSRQTRTYLHIVGVL